jgi:hypothetical protein
MTYTIKDLSEGRVAVINDGTKAEIRSVLEAAFPAWKGWNYGITGAYQKKWSTCRGWLNTDDIDLPTQSVKLFLTSNGRALSPVNAMRIIDVACAPWKQKLAEQWGKNIVLDETITVSEEDYKAMHNACTADQHKLFDEIFGSNHPKDGIPMWVRNCDKTWHLRYADGNGGFYTRQRKHGETDTCNETRPFDPNDLPYNE